MAQDNYYFPQVFFNTKEADSLLGPGTATIEGIAYTKPKGAFGQKAPFAKKQYATAGTVVTLFPRTSYFETWYELQKKYNDNKTAILMSAQAFSYRLEAYTDSYGRFKFINLRPGKYFMEAVIPYNQVRSYQQVTGYTEYYRGGNFQGSSPIYSTFFYNYHSSNRETLFVEVTKEGQLVEVKLK
jgi:hypothetical protein